MWLGLLVRARRCDCSPPTVSIDIHLLPLHSFIPIHAPKTSLRLCKKFYTQNIGEKLRFVATIITLSADHVMRPIDNGGHKYQLANILGGNISSSVSFQDFKIALVDLFRAQLILKRSGD
jgi:hypothetical protein